MNEAQFSPDRRVSRRRFARGARPLVLASALASLLSLGACSSTPDWANPVEWYKGATSVFDSDKEPASEPKTDEAAELRNRPVPGAGEPFPNLASVPDRPKSVTSSDERKRITANLVADRDNARYVDPPPPRPTVVVPPPPPYSPSSSSSSSSSSTSTPAPAPAPSAQPAPPSPPAAAAVPPPPAPVPPPRPTQSAQAAPPAPPPAPSVSAAPRPRVADSQPTPPPAATPAPPDVVAATPAPIPRLNGPQPDAVVLFNDGSSQVSAEQRRGLAGIARDAKARDSIVRVVGRSSQPKNQTSAALLANFNASWNRAHAVADALTKLGIPASKIRVEAETSPDTAPDVASVPKGDAGLRRADIYLE